MNFSYRYEGPDAREITTDRLFLRPFARGDVKEIARLCNNRNVTKSLAYLPFPYTEADAENWLKIQENADGTYTFYDFAIIDKANGNLLGSISLSGRGKHRVGEIGYWIGEEYWGRGYCTEAAKALIRFAFEALGYDRIYARFFTSNPASGKVMKNAGMTYEGLQRQHIYKDDHYEDVALYGILKSEYQAD